MSTHTNISLSLDFNQVVDLVKQLPEDKQQQLIDLIEQPKKNPALSGTKKLSAKEKKFLHELDEAVNFVNNYKPGKTRSRSLKQMLNEL